MNFVGNLVHINILAVMGVGIFVAAVVIAVEVSRRFFFIFT